MAVLRSLRPPVLLLVIGLLLLLMGCGPGGIGGSSEPTALPFNRLTAEQVLQALTTAGTGIQNIQRDMLIGRDAPSTFSDRYIFEIASIAPNGGQVLIFDTPENLAAWQDYISSLRADAGTRRSVIYVFVAANALLQVNANLTTTEANVFRDALLALAG